MAPIPFNIYAHTARRNQVIDSVVFKSTSAVATTFEIEHNGIDDPIWSDGVDTYQPAKVGNLSTVTFTNWNDATEKTVTIVVDDYSEILGLSSTEFVAKDLTYMNLSVCTGYNRSLILDSNPNLTTVICFNRTSMMGYSYGIYIRSCNLTGTLDLSGVYSLWRGDIALGGNPNLTGLIFPSNLGGGNAEGLKTLSLNATGFVTMDLSNAIFSFANDTRGFYIGDCPNLETIIPPPYQPNVRFNYLNSVSSNDMSSIGGTLDLSWAGGGFFQIWMNSASASYENFNLTNLIMPPLSPTDVYIYRFRNAQIDTSGWTMTGRTLRFVDNDSTLTFAPGNNAPTATEFNSTVNLITGNDSLTGTVDLRWFRSGRGISVYGSPNITGFLMPSLTGATSDKRFTGFSTSFYIDFTMWTALFNQDNCDLLLYDNNYTSEHINHMMVDFANLVAWEDVGGNYIGRTIIINGNNGCVDQTSGGYNGIEAMNTLISKGFVVTANICAEALVFKTTNDVASTFSITYTGTGTPEWTDGVDTYTGTSVTFANWNDTSEKTVRVNVDENDKLTQINYGEFVNKNLTYISFAALSALTYRVWLDDNPNLTTFIHPPSTNTLDRIYIDSTGISGTFDLSGYPKLAYLTTSNTGITDFKYPTTPSTGNYRYATLSPNLNFTGEYRGDLMWGAYSAGTGTTAVNLPNASDIIFSSANCNIPWQVQVAGTQLAKALDLTMFDKGIAGLFNSSLFTSLNFYTGSTSNDNPYGAGFNQSFYLYDMVNITSLDFSNATSMHGKLKLFNNPNLTSMIFPTVTLSNPNTLNYVQPYNNPNLGYCNIAAMTNITNRDNMLIYVQDNGMTSAEVNQTLVELDNDALGTYIGRTINFGGSNACADDSSGGYDGYAAVQSLIAKGFTMTGNVCVPAIEILAFTSDNAASTTFSIVYDGIDDPVWDDGIGNTFQPARVANVSTVTFPWATSDIKSVTVDVDTFDGNLAIKNFSSTGLLSIDLSNTGGVDSDWNFSSNPGLTSLAVVSGMNTLLVNFCTSLAALDFTNAPATMSSIQFQNCSSLTSISFPTALSITSYFNAGTNVLTGHVDMSNVTRIGNTNFQSSPNITLFSAPIESAQRAGNFQMTGASSYSGALDISTMYLRSAITIRNFGNLTSLTLPNTVSTAVQLLINYNNTLPSVNLNSIDIVGVMQISFNPDLTSINFNSATNTNIVDFFVQGNDSLGYIDITGFANPITEIDNADIKFDNNNWTDAIVNQILVDLDSISTDAYIGRLLAIGGNNGNVNQTSGGVNGYEAYLNLVAKGFTVTANLDPEALVFKTTINNSPVYSITYTGTGTPSWTDGTDTYTGTSVDFVNWADDIEKQVILTVEENDKVTGLSTTAWKSRKTSYFSLLTLSGLTGTVSCSWNVGLLTKFLHPPNTNTISALKVEEDMNTYTTTLPGTFDLSNYTYLHELSIYNTGITDFIYPVGTLQDGPYKLYISNGSSANNIFTGSIDITQIFGTTPHYGMVWHLCAPNAASLTIPTSGYSFTDLVINSTPFAQVLDLSNYTGISQIDVGYSDFTEITMPTSTFTLGSYQGSMDFDGMTNLSNTTLDLSNMANYSLGGHLNFWNADWTNITFPATAILVSSNFTRITMSYNSFGYVDFTNLTGLLEKNSRIFYMDNNNMTATEVNHVLVDLDSISTGAFTGRTIRINGTNAAPDGTSGGYDGTTAVSNLVAKGFTVTHS